MFSGPFRAIGLSLSTLPRYPPPPDGRSPRAAVLNGAMTDADDLAAARARALASPLRWRILRLALHEPRTNRELADLLEINPGTMLHHVRTLVDTGYLEAQPPRRGTRNAREVPYLATRLTWTQSEHDPNLASTFTALLTQELAGVDPGDLRAARLGVRLSAADLDEFGRRLDALIKDLAERDDPDGEPWSLMAFLYPDAQQQTQQQAQQQGQGKFEPKVRPGDAGRPDGSADPADPIAPAEGLGVRKAGGSERR